MSQTKKYLGQHWLTSQPVLEAIADGAAVAKNDYVLEVGPGLGTLTDVLLNRGAYVHAVELDKDLIQGLKAKFSNDSNFELSEADILKFDLSSLPKNFKVVANIPYYLTSNFIRLLSESDNHFSRAALLIQKEVAERVCAKPGQMSILSVATQYYSEVSLGDVVEATLFNPPPKVDSQVLKLKRRTKPLFGDIDTEVFFRLVRAGFSEKRKMLRSSLSGGLGISKPEAELLLDKAGIPAEKRAQQLSLEEWHSLYSSFYKLDSCIL